MRSLVWMLIAVFAVTACTGPVAHPGFADLEPIPAPAGPSSERLTVFISDMHLGVGRDPATGRWHEYEDFRWRDEFVAFLKAVDALGGGRTDLVLNGDTFEFWQSLDDAEDDRDCLRGQKGLGLTEPKALRLLRRVLGEHADELRSLGEFARSGTNTVTFVPGNHDAALLFPAVARAVVDAVPAPPRRARVLRRGYWISTDGLVYAEHGHQIGQEVNRFDGWPSPFVEHQGQVHLRRPWGEQFVQCYYNLFERRYPVIDNISEEAVAVRYALAAEGRLRAAADSAAFLRFFLLGVSWAQLGQSLGEPEGSPDWDEAVVRAEGARFLVESVAADDPLRPALEQAARDGTLGLSVASLTSQEIRAICDRRATLAAAQRPVIPCSVRGGGLGAIAERLVGSRNEIYGAHLKEVAANVGARDRRFEVFVYSHTHRIEESFKPLEDERLGWNPQVVNTGAWQRVITPTELEKRPGTAEQILRQTPEALPPCYSLVLVQPYPGRSPSAVIRSWRRTPEGTWHFGGMCGE